MLEVRIRPLQIGKNPNGLLRHRVQVLNNNARAVAREMELQCCFDGCDEHPDEPSTITVVPHWDGRMTYEKTDFCCSVFSRNYEFHDADWVDEVEQVAGEADDVNDPHQLCLWP